MKNAEQMVKNMVDFILADTETSREEAREALRQSVHDLRPVRKNSEDFAMDILLELGAPDHLVGYPYVVEALKMAVEDREWINKITAGLYPQLAIKFGTTPSRVERAIRHLVEVTWNRGDLEVLSRYFGNTVSAERGKPTNGEFIARVANIIRQKMRE